MVKVIRTESTQVSRGVLELAEEYVKRIQHRGLAGAVPADEAGIVAQCECLVTEAAEVLNAHGFA